MARLTYLDASDLPPEDRAVLSRSINLNRLLAHSPNGARAIQAMAKFIRHTSRLDGKLRELAILQIAYLCGGAYQFSHHVKIGLEFGLTDLEIKAIRSETEGADSSLSPLAKAVLRAAREMTLDGGISNEVFSTLQRELDNECLVDLVIAISFYVGAVRLHSALQVDVEASYLPYLDEYPLPAGPGADSRNPSRPRQDRAT
jgi:alkylhydroperoxidase family enzyme